MRNMLRHILTSTLPFLFLTLFATPLFSSDKPDNAPGVTCEVFHVTASIHTGTANKPALTVPIIREHFEPVAKTSTIPLIKGHGLAVMFTLNAPYSALETVRLVVNHPEMKSPDDEISPQVDRTQATMLVDGTRMVAYSYNFDEDWELVEGKWSIEIFTGDKRIGSTKVLTYNPESLKFPAFNPRLITLASARTATDDDRQFLEERSRQDATESYAATALLYRFWPEKYHAQFVQSFRITPDTRQTILPDEEINNRVNTLMQVYAGRHPLEICTLLYAGFRKSGFARRKPDGGTMLLEMMFRGSLFTGIAPNQNINDVLRLAAIADGKTLQPEPAH